MLENFTTYSERVMSFYVNKISKEQMPFLTQMAKEQGWNPGLDDAEAFYAADPDGFFIAELEGEPIGCISAVSYSDDFGFVGFYVMKKGFEGNYFGSQLALKAMRYLYSKNIGLDGVIERIDNYTRLGFKFAYPNARYEFTVPDVLEHTSCSKIRSYSDDLFHAVSQYDTECFPADRSKFLKVWLNAPNSQAKVIIDNGRVRGYSVVRKCDSGYKIGPLFADGMLQADNLFLETISTLPAGEKVFLDIPEINMDAKILTAKYEMTKVFETARMYSREKPNIDLNKVFGITSFELG